jgi:hypothetical protein
VRTAAAPPLLSDDFSCSNEAAGTEAVAELMSTDSRLRWGSGEETSIVASRANDRLLVAYNQ